MEEIKELIAKIQEEGVKKAEEKALKIEEEAKKAAGDILHKARTEAEKIIQAAKEASTQMQQATQSSLQQAGRDLILSLKKEINALLEKMISHQIRQALKPEELNKIILALVKEHSQKEGAQIEILLNKEDLEKLEEGFLEKLKGEVKKGVLLKPSEDILAGFLISYDSGKSFFDFTDQALVEYIGNYLKPQLAGILK